MTGPVERKVAWASIATYVGSAAGVAALQAVTDAQLVTALPDILEPLVLALLPAASTFLGGYKARHTPRPDIEGPEDRPAGHAAGPDRPPFNPADY